MEVVYVIGGYVIGLIISVIVLTISFKKYYEYKTKENNFYYRDEDDEAGLIIFVSILWPIILGFSPFLICIVILFYGLTKLIEYIRGY